MNNGFDLEIVDEIVMKSKEEIVKVMYEMGIVGVSDAIVDTFIKSIRIAKSDATVIIYGESGVGKELFAEVIHKFSKRKSAPFVRINCAAIPETLLESELFGYEKGAFTGANKSKPGLFETANGGTIFLDEIGEISVSVQTKLLRVIEEKKIIRVGGIENKDVDVRIIAATNRDLWEEVARGNFRDDLFYRVNVISLYIPPLRNRKEDIIPLAEYFMKTFCERERKPLKKFQEDFYEFLLTYPFPGNVRELSNFIERAIVLSDNDTITLEYIPEYVFHIPSSIKNQKPETIINTFKSKEKTDIIIALKKTNFNLSKAAKLLGMHRNTLSRKIKEYEIKIPK